MALLNNQNEKMRNNEPTRLSIPVLTSQPYYPQSSILRGIAANRKSKFDVFIHLKRGEEKLIRIFFRFSYKNNISI